MPWTESRQQGISQAPVFSVQVLAVICSLVTSMKERAEPGRINGKFQPRHGALVHSSPLPHPTSPGYGRSLRTMYARLAPHRLTHDIGVSPSTNVETIHPCPLLNAQLTLSSYAWQSIKTRNTGNSQTAHTNSQIMWAERGQLSSVSGNVLRCQHYATIWAQAEKWSSQHQF